MRKCVACGWEEAMAFYSGLLRCSVCGHVWADMELSPAELAELYRRDYFFGDEYLDYVADRAIIQKNFGRRLEVLGRHVEPARHRSLLEIGCAYGFFLDLAKRRFETVAGIDITEDGVRYARETLGLEVVQADLLSHDFRERRFDVVCLWDTIEHLPRPDLVLERVASLTDAGALVSLTTGDIGSVNARLAGKSWRLIHPPTHLHYFTRASLARLLDRLGFDVVYDRSCGAFRGADFTAYNLFVLRSRLSWVYALLRRMGLTRFGFYLNLGDIRHVVARRRPASGG